MAAVSKRPVSGILLLDKWIDATSNSALQRIKRLFAAKKAGHTGSLDPLATGMLPICFGAATKFSQYLLTADKAYEVTLRLGIATTTGDAEGEVISTMPVPAMTAEAWAQCCAYFTGEVKQIPSMYSALKHQGKPLYEYARQGITIPRPERTIQIYTCECRDFSENSATLFVRCSKGTYIRSLVEDMGVHLGTVAHVAALRRVAVGAYAEQQMLTYDALNETAVNGVAALDRHLLPVETLASQFPSVSLSPSVCFQLRNTGQCTLVSLDVPPGFVRLTQMDGTFVGVGEVMAAGQLRARTWLPAS